MQAGSCLFCLPNLADKEFNMYKLLIDCDTGIDDSLALLFAMKRPDVRVMGIIASYGNTYTRQAAENSLRLIRLAAPGYEIPVALGAEGPLLGVWAGPHPDIHGKNGIGNVELPASSQRVLEEDGIEFLVRTVRENPGEITLVTLGRLTDIALALDKEPDLPKLVKNMVIMGGTLFHSGNVAPNSEANIAGDPEAADRVFTAGFNLMIVGLDVTAKTHLTEEKLQCLNRYCTEQNKPAADYLTRAMHQVYFPFNRKQGFCLDYCPVHDPLAVLAAIDPTVFIFRKLRIRVETGGVFSRGRLVADLRETPFDAPYSDIAVDVDGERAVETIIAAFTGS